MTHPTDIPIVLVKETDPWGMAFCYYTWETNPREYEGFWQKIHVSGILLEHRSYIKKTQHGLWPTYFRNGILSNRSTLDMDGGPVGYYIGRYADDTMSSRFGYYIGRNADDTKSSH